MTQFTITQIWIYPIKSLGGIRLQKANVRGKGLQFDRRWMLVDEAGVAMTQRAFPLMSLFKPEIVDDKMTVTYVREKKKISSTMFNLIPAFSCNRITALVWGDVVDVVEVHSEVSDWFSQHLDTRCRLVAFPEENARLVNPDYSVNGENVSLADGYPFLIIGERSLDDLNARLDRAVPMNRFRPNFVFEGGEPFAEDSWKTLRIGKIPFAAVKKSARCALTTVDQDTAEKGIEPLRTLSNYRKIDNNVYFGQNLVALESGEVNEGDPVIPA
jgi:uncharacterized protein